MKVAATPWIAVIVVLGGVCLGGWQTPATTDDPAALVALAEKHQAANDHRRALEAYERALPLYRARQDRAGEARVLGGLGATHVRLSDYRKAVEHYDAALAACRDTGDRQGEAAALAGIGAARVRLNQYAEAVAVLEDAIPLFRARGDRAGEAGALQSIGYARFSQDEYATAIDVYSKALALAKADGARGLEASIVYNQGQVYYHLGDYQRALNLYNEALAVHRTLANRSGEAAALSALGRVYRFLGEYDKALDHHAQAITILRAIGERMNEATSLNNSGHVHLSTARYADARPFFEQSLQICLSVGNRAGEASNTNGIGLVHAGLKQYDQALPYHREALRLFRSLGHKRAEADSLGHIGRAYEGLGDFTQARAYLGEALALYRAVRVPRQESETLYARARVAQKAGDLAAATGDIDQAIDLAEGFRQDVASSQLRTSYQGTIRDFYELKVDVLMQSHAQQPAGAQAAAFDASERARARGLLDLLAAARAEIGRDIDPALVAREQTVRQRLAGRAERQSQLAAGNPSPEQLDALSREIEADLAEYDSVQAQIRTSHPRYAALMQPEPLTLKEIQNTVLDADTVLLEYFLGNDRSYVWVVTKDGLATRELPRRAEIDAAAQRFYTLLSTNARRDALQRAARALSDMLLAPVAAHVRGKRLAVAADGALHYVPFAALPDPNAASQPLIVNHEIVSLPSGSTVAALRRDAQARAAAPGGVKVFADPVFDAADVRVKQRAPAATTNRRDATWPPPRLLGTRREARAILALLPPGQGRDALDFAASREAAMASDLAAFRVVHFATHAIIDNQHPELSGLVLSLVDRDGRARDGFLRLTDIYNLRLSAELVVLSACRTGLGKEFRGEGLVGLTRGFMYAGAPRVVTSLWQVDDTGTTELMSRFYRALLAERRPRAAAALRQAQIDMWKNADWQAPYYWAAFVLQGEWQSPSR